jgi:hypothetical protein
MRSVRMLASACGVLAALGSPGCAALACAPVTLVVAQKEERARIGNLSHGLYRTTETGRVEPVLAPGVVREYWVRSARGDWYRVTPEQFDAARVNRPLDVCR